jgi:hypothetical protein
LKMGAESKDPENFYRCKDRLREFDRGSVPERLATRIVVVVEGSQKPSSPGPWRNRAGIR